MMRSQIDGPKSPRAQVEELILKQATVSKPTLLSPVQSSREMDPYAHHFYA